MKRTSYFRFGGLFYSAARCSHQRSLGTSMASETVGPGLPKEALHIVALGSSFAAGPGIQPQGLKAAGRSENNYAHLLATRLDARLTDLSVSGATLLNVLSEPQVFFGNHFEPQLSSFPADADIVTLTGGGNDVNYIGSVLRATLETYSIGRLLSRFISLASNEAPTVAEVAGRFIAIIDAIKIKAPDCQIYLVEYLTLFGPDTRAGVDVSFDEKQISKLQDIAKTLQTAYSLAADARPGVQVVPVAKRSGDHGIGATEPWVEGFRLGMLWSGKAPFHPNARGMEAVAEILYEEITGTKER